jgi:hypothetical protein
MSRHGGPAARGRGAAGSREQGQSRDISPIVPQREQKSTTGARPGTGDAHLQHKDSGRGSRVAWGPRPYGLSSTHSSYSTPSQTSSGMSLAIWAGTGVRAGAVSSAVLWLLVVVPWGFSWGLPGWGVPNGGCPVGVAGRETDGWAAGLGSGLSTLARATSTSSTTVHSKSSRWSMVWTELGDGGTCGYECSR